MVRHWAKRHISTRSRRVVQGVEHGGFPAFKSSAAGARRLPAGTRSMSARAPARATGATAAAPMA
jgi:hypothetical protein